MSYKVDNAVIMAAGTSSRFAPLSYEVPKALIEVRGEILIERQIKQLQEAGVKEVFIVVGYKKEYFNYLKEKYGVILVENKEYMTRNNNSSIFAARDCLSNSFVCSADNYFKMNPFETEVDESYYSALFAEGETREWCMKEDEEGFISDVTIGGSNAWYMLGHTFWNEEFSKRFISILNDEYNLPETSDLLWESIFLNHLDVLKMRIRKYEEDILFEFDTLDELRTFDTSYIDDTRSGILKSLARKFACREKDFSNIQAYKDADNTASGFRFEWNGNCYKYQYQNKKIERVLPNACDPQGKIN